MTVDVEEVKNDLLEALEHDKLVLPTLPEIALQVREAANDPNTDISRLQDLIGNDAALSARVVRVANSPLVRGVQAIEHLQAALSRLGVTYSCNLVLGLAMEQMFQATNDGIDSRLREVWSRSAEVAAIANVLCQHYTTLEPDKATLAGLTQLIGVLPVLTYAEENEILLEEADAEQLDSIIEAIAPDLGVKILESWNFHPSLAHVPKDHLDYHRGSDQVDYIDIVVVARLQSYVYEAGCGRRISSREVPAVAKLGLEVDDSEDLELGLLIEEIDMAVESLQ